MSNNINTTEFLVTAARDAFSTLKRTKGQRPLAVLAFLEANTDDERDLAIESWGAGFVRRGLREAAVFFVNKDDEETANVFWTLRDSVTDEGFLNGDDGDVVEDAA